MKRTLSCFITIVMLMTVIQIGTVSVKAIGSFPVGAIADVAETYYDGQDVGVECKPWVNNVVWSASGGSMSTGGGYQSAFSRNGFEVSSENAVRGDIIQVTPIGSLYDDTNAFSYYNSSRSDSKLHTMIILSNNGSNNFSVIDSNWKRDECIYRHDINPYSWASGSIIMIWRLGTYSPLPPKPGKPTLRVPATNFSTEPVIFTWDATSNTTQYDIRIYKDGSYYCGKLAIIGTSFSCPLPVGSYSAYLCSVNANLTEWWTAGDSVSFSVVNKPINMNISTNNKNTQHVVLSWNAIPNAVSYSLKIDANGNGGAEDPNDVVVTKITTTSYSVLLPCGSFSTWIDAISSDGKVILTNWSYRPTFTVTQGDYVPQKTVFYNGHIYSLYDNFMSWKEAKSVCGTLGGHLVTITSKGEQDVINTLLASGKRLAYNIGGSDEAIEGTFKWVTGETFSSFMNWNTGQPDNWNGIEDYLMVYSSASILGKWNDDANYNPLNINTFGFICEVEPVGLPVATTTNNGSKYMLFDNKMTWQDAKAMCDSLGGHLATITSSSEQEVINSLISKGKNDYYFIGLSDMKTEGKYEWVTNEALPYTHWHANQPDNWNGYEDYIGVYKSASAVLGQWNDFKNFAPDLGSITSLPGFVCERLTSPTIAATPTIPTNGNVTVNISYPALATTREYKIGTSAWTLYTAAITLASNNTVYARCSDGPGYYSPTSSRSITNIDKTPPVLPTILLDPIGRESRSVTLTVTYPVDAVVKEYRVGTGIWTAYTGPVALFANSDVSARCKDAAGNLSAMASAVVTNIAEAPALPIGLKAVSTSYNSIEVSWDAVSGATGYLIYRYNETLIKYECIKTTTLTSYTNASLTTGKTYTYKVFAYKTVDGVNIYSTASTVVSAKPIPATPTNFKAVRYSSTSIKLTWDPVTGASGYVLYKYNNSTKIWDRLRVQTATSYINTGLTKGVTYSYKVRAYRTVNGSPVYGNPSGQVSAKTY